MLKHPLNAWRNKLAKIREDQTVRVFHYIDFAAKLVVLVSNAVVQRLPNDPRIVLLDRRRK